MGKKKTAGRIAFDRVDVMLKDKNIKWYSLKAPCKVSKQVIHNWIRRESVPEKHVDTIIAYINAYPEDGSAKSACYGVPITCQLCMECRDVEFSASNLSPKIIKCILYKILLYLHGSKDCACLENNTCVYLDNS